MKYLIFLEKVVLKQPMDESRGFFKGKKYGVGYQIMAKIAYSVERFHDEIKSQFINQLRQRQASAATRHPGKLCYTNSLDQFALDFTRNTE